MDGAQAGKPELIMALDADDPTVLLGFALYLPFVDDPEACALVYLAVDAGHRRQGIGRAMVEAMVTRYPHAEVACVAGKVPYFKSEEHTSELQSLMRISYAVFCLQKKSRLLKNKYL